MNVDKYMLCNSICYRQTVRMERGQLTEDNVIICANTILLQHSTSITFLVQCDHHSSYDFKVSKAM